MTLAEGGARVLVLEAGPDLSRAVAFGTPVGNMLRRLAGISSGRHRRQAQYRPGLLRGAFAAAVTSSSAYLAIIIPPSIPMIVYAVMSQSSVVQ